MSTVMMSRAETLANIEQLQQDARGLEMRYNQEMSVILKKIADVAGASTAPAIVAPNTVSAPKSKKKSGRPAVKESGKRNELSLKEAVLDILGRTSKEWASLVPGLSDDVEGLELAEIKEIIEKEGKWTSDKDIGTQLSQALYHLRKDDQKIIRENRKYSLIKEKHKK